MLDMLKLMKTAAGVQKDIQKAKDSLAGKTVEFSGKDGMVTVTATADLSVKSIRIDPRAINPARARDLEQLVLTAVQGALASAREHANAEMSKITSRFGLPGLSL